MLLAVGGLALAALWSVLVVVMVRRPPRRALGAALAERLPEDPRDASGRDFRELEVAVDPARGADGPSLPAWVVEGDGARGTVVLLHGWGQGRIDLTDAIEPWAPHAARVVAPDLPAHGDAGGRCGLGDGDAGAVVALLRALEDEAVEGAATTAGGADRARPVLLVGRSLGAVAAVATAARAPELVDGVIAAGAWDAPHAALVGRLRRMELPRTGVARTAAWLLARLGAGRTATGALLAACRVPVLLVHGREDDVCPVADAHAMAAAATGAGANVELVEIEGGHRAGPFDPGARVRTIAFVRERGLPVDDAAL